MLLSEGLLLMAKQVQSKHPASCPGQEAPSNIWIWELIGSSIAHKAGMGAWVPGPSVQADIEREPQRETQGSGTPRLGRQRGWSQVLSRTKRKPAQFVNSTESPWEGSASS